MSLSTSAKLIKGGFIGLDPDNGARYRASSRCTSPDMLTRSPQARVMEGEVP